MYKFHIDNHRNEISKTRNKKNIVSCRFVKEKKKKILNFKTITKELIRQ